MARTSTASSVEVSDDEDEEDEEEEEEDEDEDGGDQVVVKPEEHVANMERSYVLANEVMGETLFILFSGIN